MVYAGRYDLFRYVQSIGYGDGGDEMSNLKYLTLDQLIKAQKDCQEYIFILEHKGKNTSGQYERLKWIKTYIEKKTGVPQFLIDNAYTNIPDGYFNRGQKMKNFNTERIELILILAGVFLGAYLFLMALQSILRGLWYVFIV